MQTCQVMYGNNQCKRVEFNGIKTTYQCGEHLTCCFTVPEFCKPEFGDWVGIFPIGWKSIRDCVCRKMVRIEEFVGQCGKVVFDCDVLPKGSEQYFQCVYLKNGECRGTSTPFMFVPTTYNNLMRCEEMYYKPTETTRCFTGVKQPRTLEQVVMREMQNLQQGITGLDQCLGGYKTFQCEEPCIPTTFTTSTTTPSYMWSSLPCEFTTGVNGGKPTFPEFTWTGVGEMTESYKFKKFWQNKMVKLEQILKEKIRIEQAQRRLDQLNMIAQLKSFERHIMCVQMKECEIKNYFEQKMQKQVAEFEQKVMKYQIGQQTPEFYVKKYELMQKEKIELDLQKRIAILHKLRQTIKECERKLRELQNIECEHFVNFQRMLKSKFEHFECKYVMPTISTGLFTEKVHMDLVQQFECLISSFLSEQNKLHINLCKAHKELFCLVGEICTKLQEMEFDGYTTLRIPRVLSTGFSFDMHPKLSQFLQVEKKIQEQKNKLRIRMFTTPKCYEQMTTGEWLQICIEQLKNIKFHLKNAQTVICGQTVTSMTDVPCTGEFTLKGLWFEKKIDAISHIYKCLCHLQTEMKTLDEIRLRNVLTQLRDLECELYDCPQFLEQFQSRYFKTRQIVELCQQLQCIVREKICLLVPICEQQTSSPFECLVKLGNHPSMIELIELEKKLVEMKGMAVAAMQYIQLEGRLGDLEQYMKECFTGLMPTMMCMPVAKQEKCFEQIRMLRTMLEQHIEFQPTFLTVPEQFVQHQQKYERLCQLITNLECHFFECQMRWFQEYRKTLPVNQPFTSTNHVTTTTLEGQQSTVATLTYIYQKFQVLVEEFQCQFPEFYSPKFDGIISFFKTCTFDKVRCNTVYYCQQLKQRICDFESILCQPEFEIVCLTQSCVYPTQRTPREYLKYFIRQCRDLKYQCQCFYEEFCCDIEESQRGEICCDDSDLTLSGLMSKLCVRPTIRSTINTDRQVICEGEEQPDICMVIKSVSGPIDMKSVNIGKILVDLEGELNKMRCVQKETTTTTPIVNKIKFEVECESDENDWTVVLPTSNTTTTTGPFSQITTLPSIIRIESESTECGCPIEKQIKQFFGCNNDETMFMCPVCCFLVDNETTTITTPEIMHLNGGRFSSF